MADGIARRLRTHMPRHTKQPNKCADTLLNTTQGLGERRTLRRNWSSLYINKSIYISIVEILLNKMLNWPKRRRTLRRDWSSQCHKTLFSRQRLVTYISPPAFRQAWVRSNKLLQTSFSDEFKVWQLFLAGPTKALQGKTSPQYTLYF